MCIVCEVTVFICTYFKRKERPVDGVCVANIVLLLVYDSGGHCVVRMCVCVCVYVGIRRGEHAAFLAHSLMHDSLF